MLLLLQRPPPRAVPCTGGWREVAIGPCIWLAAGDRGCSMPRSPLEMCVLRIRKWQEWDQAAKK